MKILKISILVFFGLMNSLLQAYVPYASRKTQRKSHMQLPHKIKKTKVDKKLKLNQALRKLWSEHVIWTKQFIVSFLADLPDVEFAKERLLQNQEDFGKAIVPYYGKAAGDKLAELLKEHIVIAAEVAKAAKENNSELVKEKDALWRQNAKDIAKFLAGANPYWKEKDLLHMLNIHLDLLTDEVTSRLKADWAGDVEAFNKTYDEALMMGDAFAQGIIKQFPNKF